VGVSASAPSASESHPSVPPKKTGPHQRLIHFLTSFPFSPLFSQIKTEDTDGYNAVQVGYDQVKDYKITKPEVGHCAKAGAAPMRHLEEFRLKQPPSHAMAGLGTTFFLT
jgi:hypothetical protein